MPGWASLDVLRWSQIRTIRYRMALRRSILALNWRNQAFALDVLPTDHLTVLIKREVLLLLSMSSFNCRSSIRLAARRMRSTRQIYPAATTAHRHQTHPLSITRIINGADAMMNKSEAATRS